MLEIKFNNHNDLINFLLENHIKEEKNKEFILWETVIFRIGVSNGYSLTLDTKVNDTASLNYNNNNSYMLFKKALKNLVNVYEDYKHLEFNIEIKLKFPESYRKVIDPDDEFQAFYVNFFIEDSEAFLLTSFMEKNEDISVQPVIKWNQFIANLYKKWEEWKRLNNN